MHRLITIILLALTIGAQARISHPSLLFTPEKVRAAKARIDSDTVQARAWQLISDKAEGLLVKNDVRQLEYLALAWQMTGDKRYADKVCKILADVAALPAGAWADAEMMARNPQWRSELQMAHRAFQLAVAYDAVYDEMSARERKKIAHGLWQLAVEPMMADWLVDSTRIHSLNSMGHNWWTSCTGMGALLALALSNEIPEGDEIAQQALETLPEWFDFAGDVVQGKSANFDAEGGGMYESVNYASFGTTEALLLRLAWLNSHPGAKLEPIPQLEQLPEFFCQVAYPRSEGELWSLNFGDSHKNVTGESSILLAWAMGVQDPATLWYVNQLEPGQHREGFPRHFPMGFLYTPDMAAAPVVPNLETAHIWPQHGWATMRTGWKPDATMMAVKSGQTWNHSHADANSLVVWHRGADLIKDAGNCNYGKPEYRQYFFQSDAHNVVKVNGKGQPTYQQYHGTLLPGSVSGLTTLGDMRYVMADGTGPMADQLSRNQRHYLWIGNVILVIDDLRSHEPASWEWLWHPGGEVKKKGGTLHISNGDASLAIKPIWPAQLAPSNYVHDYPELLWWEVIDAPTEDLKSTEQYYSLHLPMVTDRVKGVTAIILKDSADDKEMPTVTPVDGKGWVGIDIDDHGRKTRVYINQLADGRLMHLNSWIEADGWSTDAYILAVDEQEGPVFVGYGSALRSGEDVYFSSLSKLNVMARRDGSSLNLEVNGQPRLNLRWRSDTRPKSITLNGFPVTPDYSDRLLHVKIK